MGVSLRGNRRFVSEINVTPFVDVMLVLLIIFIVTAPMMTEGLEVNLPTTNYVENLPTESENMVLTIKEDSSIFLNTYPIKIDELSDKLQLLVKEKNKQLFLQADKNVPYGVVVDIMGRVRIAGIERLGVLAQYEDSATTVNVKKP